MQSDEGPQRQPLRRGENNSATAAAMLPVEPSFIFDDLRATFPASQLGSQLPTLSASRQRPRFATAQDLDDALLQVIEGKITRKNAWASKDASNLLEGITHTVGSTLDAATTTDEYSSFAKVATVVEGCSKVWTSRVDSTYQRSNQMVRRLLRNEEGGGDGSDKEGNGEDDDGPGDGSAAAAAAAERRKKAAQRRTQSVRTIALDPSEINLDGKGRMALVHTGMNAQFRAITEKFDQGNAQGLLMHNTPLGNAGNLILDVDYARERGREYSARKNRLSGGSRHAVKQEPEAEETGTVNTMEEFDTGLDTPLDLPPFLPFISTTTAAAGSEGPNSLLSNDNDSNGGGGGGRRSGGGGAQGDTRSSGDDSVKTEAATGRPSMVLPSLLLLPHTVPLETEEGEGGRMMAARDPQDQHTNHLQEGGVAVTSLLSTDYQQQNPPLSGYDEDVDAGDWGGGMDYYDDYDNDDNTGVGVGFGGDGSSINTEGMRERIAMEARHLVSGVSELNALDDCLFGENRLALEAEDPTSWFPLSEPPANPFLGGGGPKNSELQRLHKEHRLNQTSPQTQGVFGPGTKRTKREKTVAFDLPGELAFTSSAADSSGAGGGDGENSLSSSSFLLGGSSGVDSSALKQSTTQGKNITPLGKELLLGKDPNAILAYTQSVVQRAKAQEAGLLLAEPPVPGKTIPSYLPYPIVVQSFFQPFSTPLLQWNLLQKSASGHALALSSGVPSRRVSAVIGKNNWDTRRNEDTESQFGGQGLGSGDDDDGGGSGSGAVGPMPVEFFHGGAEVDDEYMGGGDFDDYNDDADGGAFRDTDDSLRRIESEILSSFERSELARVSAAMTVASDGRRSGADALAGVDPMTLVKVLQPPQTALPSQVDVVRLRQAMWGSLEDAMRNSAAVRSQQQEPSHDDNDDTHGEHETMMTKKSKKAARKRQREQEEEKDADDEGDEAKHLPRFSDVVLPLLPQVPTISATGTLSPAFFFFSILFLANEHGVVLESVPGLDDLIVRSVSHPTASTVAAE